MRLIAIDPGSNGGIAACTVENGTIKDVTCIKMPETIAEIKDAIVSLSKYDPDVECCLERTGTYMPGQSGPASVKFARHCGNLEGILIGINLPSIQVAPQKWQKAVFGNLPKDKAERKRYIKDTMQRLYPNLSVTLATADALAILQYAIALKR